MVKKINLSTYYLKKKEIDDVFDGEDAQAIKNEIDKKINKSDIQDNLTSTETDKPLSAKQGKELKSLVDGKASSSHTHTKSQITDFPTTMTPSSHAHGNITNDGIISNQASKNVVTDANGKITTEAKPTIPTGSSTATDIKMNGTQSAGSSSNFAKADHVHPTDTSRAAANHNHDGTYLKSYTPPTGSTSQAGIVKLNSATNSTSTSEAATPSAVKSAYDLASNKTVTLTKLSTATTGYIATYEVKQGGTSLGKIDIPKDYLVKSGSVKTVSTANSPVNGYAIGDKYIDFVINTKDSSGTDEHVYINVKDLIDTYEPATQSANGLMTAADKKKLDGIATGANAYTHPSGTAKTGEPTENKTPAFGSTFTVTQFTSNSTGHISGATNRTVKIPNNLGNGTTAGLSTNDYTTTEKNKLAGIATGATKNTVSDSLSDSSTTNALSAAKGKDLQTQINNIVSGETATDHNHDGQYIKTGTGTVTSTNIADKTIVNGDIADGTIESGKIKDGAVTNSKLSATIIPNGTNLNTIKTIGFYAQPLTSNTSTMVNLPNDIHRAFTMIVEPFTDGGVTQTLTFWYDGSQQTPVKRFVRNGTSYWSKWVELTDSRYDGNFISGHQSPTKPYLRLFNLKAKNSDSSSSHIIFEIIGNNNDRLYAKIRVDMRQNTSTTNSSYTVTPLEVYGFNLNELYFGFRNAYPNTSLDIFRKVGAYVNFYIRYADDHTRDGTVTMYSPVVNSTESYTDLNEASTALYNASYTTTSQGGTYDEVTNTIPYTNINANKFVKTGGTSSQFLKADGSVDSNTYLTTSSASSTYQPKGNYLTSHNPVDTALSSTSTNAVQNKVINTALSGKVDTSDSRLTDARTPKFNQIVATASNIQDLNNYKTGGFYYCNSDVNNAPYIIHCPWSNGTATPYTGNKSFFLLVETWGTTSTYVKQTLTYYNGNNTYARTCNNGTWTNWKEFNTNNNDYLRLATRIISGEAIAANNIIGGSTDGKYYKIVAGKTLDVKYPILFNTSAITSGSYTDNTYASHTGVPLTNNVSGITTVSNQKQVYIEGTSYDGRAFVVSDRVFVSEDNINYTTDLGKYYIYIGASYSTTNIRFNSFHQTVYIMTRNGLAPVGDNNLSPHTLIKSNAGDAGYFKFLTIRTTGTYHDQTIEFDVTHRGNKPKTVVSFNFNTWKNSSDNKYYTNIQAFYYHGYPTPIYYIQTNNGAQDATFDFYIRRDTWDEMGVSDLRTSMDNYNAMTVTWHNEFVTALPTGTTQATLNPYYAQVGHTHGSISNNGQLNSDITSINKVAVTDSSNNLKTISQLPYSKISGTPTIPTKTSQLTNDSNFTTATGHTHNYLPLSGGTLTGAVSSNSNITTTGHLTQSSDYNATNGATGNVPVATLLSTSDSITTYLPKIKSYIGAINFTASGDTSYTNVISARYRNGSGDGNVYGMYLKSKMQNANQNLIWNRQYGSSSNWQGERVILDSSNYSTYANKTTIANNLTTATTGSALDATQGKWLYDNLVTSTSTVKNGHTHNYLPSNADGTTTGNITATTSGKGIITANKFVKNGGTNSQILLANGDTKTTTDFATSGHTHNNYIYSIGVSSTDTKIDGTLVVAVDIKDINGNIPTNTNATITTNKGEIDYAGYVNSDYTGVIEVDNSVASNKKSATLPVQTVMGRVAIVIKLTEFGLYNFTCGNASFQLIVTGEKQITSGTGYVVYETMDKYHVAVNGTVTFSATNEWKEVGSGSFSTIPTTYRSKTSIPLHTGTVTGRAVMTSNGNVSVHKSNSGSVTLNFFGEYWVAK